MTNYNMVCTILSSLKDWWVIILFMFRDTKPKVLAVLPAIIPSTQLLIIKPLLSLAEKGFIKLKIELDESISLNDFIWPDLIVFSRNISVKCKPWLDFLLEKRIPYIYDIDDNFFEIPPESSEFAKNIRQPLSQYVLERFIRQASLVRTYSKELLKKIETISFKSQLVAGPLDWSQIRQEKSYSLNDPVEIVYATSRIENDNLSALFLVALEKVLEKYGDRVRLNFLGFNPLKNKKDKRIRFIPFCSNYDKFLRKFSSAGYQIGLAPLIDDVFHRSKSNIKFREYGASRIAGIYSNVDVYSDWVQNYETGILVDNTVESWYQAISDLIEKNDLRNRIRRNAFEFVQNTFSQEKFEKIWFEHILLVLKDSYPFEEAYQFPDFELENDDIAWQSGFSLWQRFSHVLFNSGIKEVWNRLVNRIRKVYQISELQIKLWKLNKRKTEKLAGMR